MRVIVVGLGVQGHKRRAFAGDDYIASVDPFNPDADYKKIEDVPLSAYDAAMLCVPDEPKVELIRYLLRHGKHVLVEKPLWAPSNSELQELENLAREKNVFCYTAYNHRFEPHFVKMRDLIHSGELGNIYHCRLFYGNGTARLVRDSAWRDQGAGVLPDLGSHLLDVVNFWFGSLRNDFDIISSQNFENASPDHVVFGTKSKIPQIEMEMTLLSWRNHFTCDIWGEKGSAHITSLCKWGPSSFIHRTRVLPSGHPRESIVTLTQPDPTWALEYAYFRDCCEKGIETDLSKDRWLNQTLKTLSSEILVEQ
jgi:scyllo-inositol 2-dehydrogenase (NADP+)